MGHIGDRIGRRRAYLIGVFGQALVAIPVFTVMSSAGFLWTLAAMALYAVFSALLVVIGSVLIAEVFPARVRMTAGAVGYNLGVGPIAGSAPLIAAALVAATGSHLAPAFYLAGLLILAGTVLTAIFPETSGKDLTE